MRKAVKYGYSIYPPNEDITTHTRLISPRRNPICRPKRSPAKTIITKIISAIILVSPYSKIILSCETTAVFPPKYFASLTSNSHGISSFIFPFLLDLIFIICYHTFDNNKIANSIIFFNTSYNEKICLRLRKNQKRDCRA